MSRQFADVVVPLVGAGVGAIAAIVGNAIGLQRDRVRGIMIELLVVDLPDLSRLLRKGVDEARPKTAEIARKATVAGGRARQIGYEMMAWVEVWRKLHEDPTITWYRKYFDASSPLPSDVTVHMHRLRNELGLIAEYRSRSLRGRLSLRVLRSVNRLSRLLRHPVAAPQVAWRSRRERIHHKRRMKRRPTL